MRYGYKPIPWKRTNPRRGRVVDRPYLAWIASQPSIVPSHDHKCLGCRVTVHHVKAGPGALKDDRRTVPLWACRHMHGWGSKTIEHGRKAFEEHFGVDCEQEIVRLKRAYGAAIDSLAIGIY